MFGGHMGCWSLKWVSCIQGKCPTYYTITPDPQDLFGTRNGLIPLHQGLSSLKAQLLPSVSRDPHSMPRSYFHCFTYPHSHPHP